LLYAKERDVEEYAYRRKFWYKNSNRNSNRPIATRGLCAKGIVTVVYIYKFFFGEHILLLQVENTFYAKSLTFENVKTLALTFLLTFFIYLFIKNKNKNVCHLEA
jgi:hypothetical protein